MKWIHARPSPDRTPAASGSGGFVRNPARATRLAVVAVLTANAAANAQQKPALTAADYGRFETLQAPVLGPDGRWLAYSILRVDEERELRLRPVDRDTTLVVAWGTGAVFSAMGRHVAWSVGVSPDERKRLERAREPVRQRASVRNLATGDERSFDAIRAFTFDASGRFLALHGYAPETPAGSGANLRVLDLEGSAEMVFGNVDAFAWSDAGSLLALTIATGTATGNAVQLYDAQSGRLRALETLSSTYRQLSWREDAADLAVLRSVQAAIVQSDSAAAGNQPADAERAPPDSIASVLLAWRDLAGASPRALRLDAAAAGLADSMVISHHRRPVWSDDGRSIAVGLRPVRHVPDATVPRDTAPPDSVAAPGDSTRNAAREEPEELPGVQIWHAFDTRVIPQQKVQAAADARRTLLAVWTPDSDRLVRIGSDLQEDAMLLEGWQHAIERVAAPYGWGAMFGRRYHDVWLIDVRTGAREKVLERVRYSWQSPGGRYLLWFDGDDYLSHDVRTGAQTNLTERLAAAFADTAYDTPTDLLPPHGTGGWIEGDRAILLYDRHDVWRVAPDGSRGERLTRGAEEEIVHRVVRLERDADAIAPDAPLYMSLHGEWSEKRGYARLRAGRSVERLVFEDRFLSGLTKADSAQVLMYRAEARDDSPDLYVAGMDLSRPDQVTNVNPFADDYAWTRTELVDYTSEAGVRLQGVLLYPVNHDPSRRYPMIVYAYEILSPQAHVWETPSEKDYYSFVAWTQQGYFVLLPDIVFRARDPGVSLLEALRPAVGTVVTRGLVDRDRVGFIGHSWGGYHGTYVATHSDLFAASVAGAPLTDFLSVMGQIHWNAGIPEPDHWETGQARMEVPYWEDPEAHQRNSPILRVHEMTTPLLLAHGDEDGVVEFFQSTEFYNFARRAGKQVVLLVYEGEDHGFTKTPNQIDYHRRILEWFGHYLKGEPAPSWITEGVLLEDHEAEKRRVARPPGKASS
jgi:dipeptidyl aminopeptidase/acylaminoacyl peptidase